MEIRISSSIEVFGPSRRLVLWARGNLRVPNPDYVQAERMGRWLGGIPRELVGYVEGQAYLSLPFGCLKEVWPMLRGSRVVLDFPDLRPAAGLGAVSLHPYQEKAVEAVLNAKGGVLIAPCGSGKTQMGLELARRIGGRGLWLTHTKALLDQSHGRAVAFYGDAPGRYAEATAGRIAIGSWLTFATVQTLSKSDISALRNAFDFVIVDECHHCVGTPSRAMMFYRVLSGLSCRWKIGLTATAGRGDGLDRTMLWALGPIAHEVDRADCADRVAGLRVSTVRIPASMAPDARRWTNGDGTMNITNLIGELSRCDARDETIADEVARRLGNGPQLVLVHRVAHAEALGARIGARLAPGAVAVATGKGGGWKGQEPGPWSVIVATWALAKEGLDVPALAAVHFATPQKDERATVQAAGRAMRRSPGKEAGEAVDYVDEGVGWCVGAARLRARWLKKISE